MSRLIRFTVGIGDLVDALAAGARAAPKVARRALHWRRARRIAAASAVAYVLVYLGAVGDIAISPSGQYGRFASTPSVQVVPDWSDRLLSARAAFLYEPIAQVHLLPQLEVLVSPGNLLLASVLAALVALNAALATEAAALNRACRRRAYGPLTAALPAFLGGMACCVPALALVVGTNVAAAVLPVLIPVRSYLFPLAAVTLLLALAWSARGLASPAAGLPGARRQPRRDSGLLPREPNAAK